jgi:rhodanese-related sulfurtransferase
MAKTISPQDLDALFKAKDTFALIDVRDAGSYNSTHIPGSSSLPRRNLEFEMHFLAPYNCVHIVLCDDDGRQATLAAATLEAMGHTRVSVLDGGINRWTTLELPTEWGTNVLSKDFGEKVEVVHHVPEIDAQDLRARQERGENLVILDTRTPQEFHNFSLPGGRSVPNGELALHITDILKSQPKDTTVIINCAGRTRSIVGTRILQRMGISNVYGVKNGTAGWVLSGLELDTGAQSLPLPTVSPQGLAAAEAYARKAAEEDGVRYIKVSDLQELMAKGNHETVYLVDVRRQEEYRESHIPGFRWFPGGQAVQRSDDVMAVARGTIVFACDGIARALLTASWYRQMGYEKVYALEGGTSAWVAEGLKLEAGIPPRLPFGLEEANRKVTLISPQNLQAMQEALLLHVDTSQAFAQGHVAGARWVPRGWLELQVAQAAPNKAAPINVTCANGINSILAGATLMDMGYSHVSVLEGGMEAWTKAGLPVEQGLTGIMTPPNDIVLMGYHRVPADTINYLRWEEALGHKYAG